MENLNTLFLRHTRNLLGRTFLLGKLEVGVAQRSFHILRSSCNGWDPDRKTASSVPAVIAVLYTLKSCMALKHTGIRSRFDNTICLRGVGHTSTLSYILGMFNSSWDTAEPTSSAPGAQAQFLESEAFSYSQHLRLDQSFPANKACVCRETHKFICVNTHAHSEIECSYSSMYISICTSINMYMHVA